MMNSVNALFNDILSKQESNKEIRAQYPELYLEIEAILFQHDPMEINFEHNTDEYEAEAGTILCQLPHAYSETDVLNIVKETFFDWFGHLAMESKLEPIYAVIAEDIWEAWMRGLDVKVSRILH